MVRFHFVVVNIVEMLYNALDYVNIIHWGNRMNGEL